MQIFRLKLLVALMVLSAVFCTSSHAAKDVVKFSSAAEAYRQGLGAYRAGQIAIAVPAFEFAAQEGVIGAQLRLARIYSKGEGVNFNHGKAFHYYQKIADRYAEANPLHPVSQYAAESFVALAKYYREGIPAMGLMQDDGEALTLYNYAASYFRDPEAQYQLARMYLNGQGTEKNVHIAAQWLLNASKKNHAASQALLGDLLWWGNGIETSPLRALALLSFAVEGASKEDSKWIGGLYGKVYDNAKPDQIERAERVMDLWRKKYGLGKTHKVAHENNDSTIVETKESVGIPSAASGLSLKGRQDGNSMQSTPGIQTGPTTTIESTTESGDANSMFRNVDSYRPAGQP